MYRSYSYIEVQQTWLKINRVYPKVTQLKIVRKLPTYEAWSDGGAYWWTNMDDMVGHTYTIGDITYHSLIIEGYYYPFYVLEVVKSV